MISNTGTADMTRLTALLLCVLFNPGVVTSETFEYQYEWVSYGRLAQYAADISFSLVVFTVPPLTQRADFLVTLTDAPTENDDRTVLLCLRKAAVPVLQAYNETLPDWFVLPSDQQIYKTKNVTNVTLTLDSPTPGRVYLVGTELNAKSDVIDYLRWGQALKGKTSMSVTASYTLVPSVATLSVDDVSTITSTAHPSQVFSFRLPGFTMSFSIIISNCLLNDSSSSNCPVTMTTAESLATHDPSSVSVDCRQEGPQCTVTILSPALEQDHYVTFSFDNKQQNITFDVTFDVQGCVLETPSHIRQPMLRGSGKSVEEFAVDTFPDDQASISDDDESTSGHSGALTRPVSPSVNRGVANVGRSGPGAGPNSSLCINQGYLGRKSSAVKETSFSFEAHFGAVTKGGEIVPHFEVVVPDVSTEVFTFSLLPALDSGGVLHITAQLKPNSSWLGVVEVCAMPRRLPLNSSVGRTCHHGALLTLNATGADHLPLSSHAYLPFPASGAWYLALQSQCRGPAPCPSLPVVNLSVSLVQCPPNNCGRYGRCGMYTDANLVWSGCTCTAGYRGLSCNDSAYSLSDGQQKRAVYLLTLSNLAFLPAILLAIYRQYLTLAAIFAFNLFFSAFYHACDASHVFQLCIMDYGTLAFCDFLGSVLSFYSVLLQMATIPDGCRSFLLMVGVLVMAPTLNSNRHSNLAHVLPLICAGVVLIASWARVMWIRKRLFPSRRRYLLFLMPGVCLAVLGISVNYGLMGRQSAYQYSHSFWHVALMLCPCFLMPPARKTKGANSTPALSISAQDTTSSRSGASNQLLHRQDEDEPAMFDASMNSIDSSTRNRLI